MSKPDTLDLLRQLDPTAGDDPAQAIGDDARTQLLGGITASRAGDQARRPRIAARRLVPVLAAAAVIAAVAVTVVRLPGDSRQEALGPALSFTTEGKFLKVRVVDPEADSARFNKEFKEHGLDIKLKLIPSSPSIVGQHTAAGFGPDSENIETTVHPAGCDNPPSYPCVPEFTIPVDYKGHAELYIGRAAKPGERLVQSGRIDGRGEPLQGVKYVGQTVATVLKILEEGGYTAEYRVKVGNEHQSRDTVPPGWVVLDGSLVTTKHAVLFVSPKR
jgi:hypothetical protein